MNKQITDWPVSVAVAVALSFGCGYVVETYYAQVMDAWGQITLPLVLTIAAVLTCAGFWIETARSYRRYRMDRASGEMPMPADPPGRVLWPAAPKDAPKPPVDAPRIFKLDE